MAGKLSFSIALNLLADNFKRGAQGVSNSLRNIQIQVVGMAAAFGLGGAGLGDLVGRMIETARATNRAQIALQNISGTAKQYGENQRFLMALSSRYGQDLNVLTSNFSKFSAAANSAGVAVSDQQKIYTSVTKATTAFGLTSDEANLSFLAITQMMAKGKISSEELRRQLGERMPIAMEAMARAAGVSIQALDKLLKQGELYSKDILPKFADELSKMLPNVNTDNVETSVNRLRNIFIQFTEGLNVGKIYKGLVDTLGGALTYLQTHFATVVKGIISGVAAIVGLAGIKKIVFAIKELTLQAEMSAVRGMKGAEKKAAREIFLANKTAATWQFAYAKIKAAMMSAFISTGIMALIALVTELALSLWGAAKEAKRVRDLFADYQKEAKNAGSANPEVIRMQSLQRIMLSKLSTHKQISSAQKELLSMLDMEKGTQADINKAVISRIALLKSAAQADFYAKKLVEGKDKIGTIASGVGMTSEQVQSLILAVRKGELGPAPNDYASYSDFRKEARGYVPNANLEAVGKAVKEVGQINKINNDAQRQLDFAVRASTKAPDTKPLSDPEETDLSKVEGKYAEEVKKLTNQKAANVITEAEYNKALNELNKKTYEEIGGLLGKKAAGNKTFKLAKAGVVPELTEFAKEQTEYNKKIKELSNLHERGILTDKEYQDELQDLTAATLKTVGAMDDIGTGGAEFIAGLKKSLANTPTPVKEKRDKTYDYKTSTADQLSNELELQEKFVDEWDKLNKKTGEFSQELQKAQGDAKNLKDAMNLAQIQEDITAYNQDIAAGAEDGARAFYQLGKNIQSAYETLSNPDISGFEKLLALIEGISQAYDGVMTIVKAIQAITVASEAMAAAKAAASGIEAASAATKSTTVVAGLTAEQIAATTLMAAASTAAYAGIPGLGVGLAAAQIATMKGMILAAAIPFATGGIVPGGSFSGDKVLAGLNSGEMVLNTGQQSRLFSALSRGGLGQGSGGQVVFEISGKKLIGILNQETTRNNRT